LIAFERLDGPGFFFSQLMQSFYQLPLIESPDILWEVTTHFLRCCVVHESVTASVTIFKY